MRNFCKVIEKHRELFVPKGPILKDVNRLIVISQVYSVSQKAWSFKFLKNYVIWSPYQDPFKGEEPFP